MNVVKQPINVTIEFAPEELQALAEVVARIGGDQGGRVRKHTDALSNLLKEHGYSYARGDNYYGSLNFDPMEE